MTQATMPHGCHGSALVSNGPVAALQHGSWRGLRGLSSVPQRVEQFLENAGFDRAPWLTVAFGCGIGAWFVAPSRWQWLALLAGLLGLACVVALAARREGRFPVLRGAVIGWSLAMAAGCAVIWVKAEVAGTPPIGHLTGGTLVGRVLVRDEQPALGRVRLIVATREPRSGRVIRVRVTVAAKNDVAGAQEGAVIGMRAVLSPPRPPLVPGSYDFARAAWFEGLAATGSAVVPLRVITPADGTSWLPRLRHAIADRVRARISGSPGGIAAAFASGDRGGIALADDAAMRDAGLTHLLSVSGLHVSAVIAIGYVVSLRLLALLPALALRVRLPLLATAVGAGLGVFYTALTGAEVPTVRSCLGALLALFAHAIGRQPLSMRLLAVVAGLVMVFWPEAVVGPSFQLSFGAVAAIIAVHQAAPVRAFAAPREQAWWERLGRSLALLLITGLVIDLALMPIALFHFHRSGLYGALANVIAIPLTTFVTMPLLLLALVMEPVGLAGPVWWLVGLSLRWLLALAHLSASQPGAVVMTPGMGNATFLLFLAGLLWLALWRGRVRLLGLVPIALGGAAVLLVRPPDVLITGDGRNLGIVSADGSAIQMLKLGKSPFEARVMAEAAGLIVEPTPIDQAPGTRCNRDFCLLSIDRGERNWRILAARRQIHPDPQSFAKACAGVDIVVIPAKVFGDCAPALFRADHDRLLRSGGLSLDLGRRRIKTVAQSEGDHPWWRAPHRLVRDIEQDEADTAAATAGAGPAASR
jgi:competence protein ComEC